MAITKVINSESQQYRPVLTDTLVLDAVPTVNSFNSVTSDAVARAVAGASGEVPQVTENDNGKVLKAIYDAGGPAVEWGEATVDQTYDATSTNAQSGTAVAQAIAAIPSASYTAGAGIDITSNTVSVNVGTGLSVSGSTTDTITLEATLSTLGGTYEYKSIGQLNAQAVAAIKNNASVNVKILELYKCINKVTSGGPDFRLAILPIYQDDPSSPSVGSGALISSTNISSSFVQIAGESYIISSNTQVTVDFANLSEMSNLSWETIEANPTGYLLMIVSATSASSLNYAKLSAYSDDPAQKDVTEIEYTVPGNNALNVSNPLPTSAVGDAGKVLTVNNAGSAEWATPSGGSSFTLTKVGTVADYLPTSGGKELSFTSVSGQSNFIDPTKLYILKVKVSQGAGGLSFGSAPYFALTSFNTEYTATNRTHLSYAFPQIYSGDMSSTASTNTPVYFFDEVANNLHIAPTGDQENDLKIEVGGVYSSSANSHRITVDLYMVN